MVIAEEEQAATAEAGEAYSSLCDTSKTKYDAINNPK